MTPDDRRHGTIAGYSAHWYDNEPVCNACRTAKNTYARTIYRQRAYGRWNPYTPTEDAANHMRTLMAQGMGFRLIADAAGISRSTVSGILYKGQKWTRQQVVDAILAVQPAPRTVPVTGSLRRVRALARMGWGGEEIAKRIGVNQRCISSWAKQQHVERSTAEKLAALYDEISMIEGPNRKAAAWARRQGYAAPLAWDDIDDKDCEPTPTSSTRTSSTRRSSSDIDLIVVERLLRGEQLPANRAEQEESVRRIMANPERTIADFAQQHPDIPVRSIAETVNTRRRRAGMSSSPERIPA